MLFNSIDFAIFLPIVFAIYWLISNGNIRLQNLFVVLASYVFYAWWDWRFLSLILLSTSVDFLVGNLIFKQENQKKRKLLLWVSILLNVGLLGFFKYYNFFLENFHGAFLLLGKEMNLNSLKIILPVGISFYTFQTLSYTIDIYRKQIKPTTDFIAFAAFVSFFPQLVAGPIERARKLLPQFHKKRIFNYDQAVDGLRQILWGLAKKILIADNCAEWVDLIYSNPGGHAGSTVFVAAFLFSFQIYGDFSGYSDIAIGTARLFGFNLSQNFAFPYFSRDIAEFWRRWHISLSSWFRDYLYIPLGGSRVGKNKLIRNVLLVFLLSGFWHGANWTFIIWGALHALYFLPLILTNKNRNHVAPIAKGKFLPSYADGFRMLTTFLLCLLAWVFFRAENLEHAFAILSRIFSVSLFCLPSIRPSDLLLMIFLLLIVEWIGREDKHALEKILNNLSKPTRWAIYLFLILSIIYFGNFETNTFIYFQF